MTHANPVTLCRLRRSSLTGFVCFGMNDARESGHAMRAAPQQLNRLRVLRGVTHANPVTLCGLRCSSLTGFVCFGRNDARKSGHAMRAALQQFNRLRVLREEYGIDR